jgi:hypothetical protein
MAAKGSLIIFDHLGEFVSKDEYPRNPMHFDYCHAFMFIFDPLSVPAARSGTGFGNYSGSYSADDFDTVVNQFVNRVKPIKSLRPGAKIDIPVAVVIAKADIEAVQNGIGAYHNDETQDEQCRQYLESLGLSNALLSVDANFTKVRYFPVSSLKGGKGVLAPMAWLAEANSSINSIKKALNYC